MTVDRFSDGEWINGGLVVNWGNTGSCTVSAAIKAGFHSFRTGPLQPPEIAQPSAAKLHEAIGDHALRRSGSVDGP